MTIHYLHFASFWICGIHCCMGIGKGKNVAIWLCNISAYTIIACMYVYFEERELHFLSMAPSIP